MALKLDADHILRGTEYGQRLMSTYGTASGDVFTRQMWLHKISTDAVFANDTGEPSVAEERHKNALPPIEHESIADMFLSMALHHQDQLSAVRTAMEHKPHLEWARNYAEMRHTHYAEAVRSPVAAFVKGREEQLDAE